MTTDARGARRTLLVEQRATAREMIGRPLANPAARSFIEEDETVEHG